MNFIMGLAVSLGHLGAVDKKLVFVVRVVVVGSPFLDLVVDGRGIVVGLFWGLLVLIWVLGWLMRKESLVDRVRGTYICM